jgi:hypothetical protein
MIRSLVLVVALAAAGACSGSAPPRPAASTSSTMSYDQCRESATYPGGGRYGVSYDNGVCVVQRP